MSDVMQIIARMEARHRAEMEATLARIRFVLMKEIEDARFELSKPVASKAKVNAKLAASQRFLKEFKGV